MTVTISIKTIKHQFHIIGKIAFISCVISLSSCYHPTAIESMNDLNTLEGNWKSYKGIEFNENWRLKNDSTFEGEGFSLNQGDTSFYEKLNIVKSKGSVYYRVFLSKGRTVDFKLTEAKKHKWKFVNPENDFPSIINYELKNDSLLHIVISNIRGNKEQFFWVKRSSLRSCLSKRSNHTRF